LILVTQEIERNGNSDRSDFTGGFDGLVVLVLVVLLFVLLIDKEQ